MIDNIVLLYAKKKLRCSFETNYVSYFVSTFIIVFATFLFVFLIVDTKE